MKYQIHMWKDLVHNFRICSVGIPSVCFTYEMADSHMKIDFTYDVFISHVELKHIPIWNTVLTWEMACEIFVIEFSFLFLFLFQFGILVNTTYSDSTEKNFLR